MNLVVADVDHEHDDLFVTLDSELRISSVMVVTCTSYLMEFRQKLPGWRWDSKQDKRDEYYAVCEKAPRACTSYNFHEICCKVV
jgi:hypothetical protein